MDGVGAVAVDALASATGLAVVNAADPADAGAAVDAGLAPKVKAVEAAGVEVVGGAPNDKAGALEAETSQSDQIFQIANALKIAESDSPGAAADVADVDVEAGAPKRGGAAEVVVAAVEDGGAAVAAGFGAPNENEGA